MSLTTMRGYIRAEICSFVKAWRDARGHTDEGT